MCCRQRAKGRAEEGWSLGGHRLPKDVSITIDFHRPFGLTAVALAVVSGHDCRSSKVRLEGAMGLICEVEIHSQNVMSGKNV